MSEDNHHAGQGAVLLDVGGDVGAIVLIMPDGTEGLEVEIRPVAESHRAVFGTDGHDDPDHVGPGHPPDHAHDHSHTDLHTHADSHTDVHAHADLHAHADSHSHVNAVHVHPWPHVGVVARPVGGRRQPSAVFGEVVEGGYDLYLRPHGPVRLTVAVIGGEVTEAVWPS